MSEKMREGFEEWASSEFGWNISDLIDARKTDDKGVDGYIFKGEYDASVTVSAAFMAWQASRESLVIELPPAISAEDAATAADCEPEYGVNIARMVNGAIMACGAFIKAAGLKVKP